MMKRITALLLTLCMLLCLAACGQDKTPAADPAGPETTGSAQPSEDAVPEVDLSGVKIGMIGIMDSGPTFDSWMAVQQIITDATGITFEYALGSSYDDTANLTTVQNLIASGCSGIIVMMDSGLQAIMQECEAAGVYMAGFGSDFRNGFADIEGSSYFLGTVKDGPMTGADLGVKAAELAIADGKKNIGVITFPQIYFPIHAEAVEGFTQTIDAYNATAAEGEQITVYDAVELPFEPLDATYFQQYPDVDAIFGPATTNFIYPTMVSANRTDVTLYADGYDNSESVLQAFNDGVIRLQTIYNSEALIYPVALIVNAVTGQVYDDMPAAQEVVPIPLDFITTPEEQTAIETKTAFSGSGSALLTAEVVTGLLKATNPDATYADLVATIQSWDMACIVAQ